LLQCRKVPHHVKRELRNPPQGIAHGDALGLTFSFTAYAAFKNLVAVLRSGGGERVQQRVTIEPHHLEEQTMTTKVLVFESDPEFSQTLKSGFSAYDCEITIVEDGEEGIALAGSSSPDLILLSIELPRMNGFSVCNKLKRNKDLKTVPLVLLSSEATEETFEQHKRLRTRADVYVHKPVTVAELVQRLDGIASLVRSGSEEEEFEEIAIDDELEEVPDSSDSVDAETDEAFGNLMAPAPAPAPEPAPEPDDEEEGAISEEQTTFHHKIPAASAMDAAVLRAQQQENASLIAEVADKARKIAELEEELRGARSATSAEEAAKAQALSKKDAELAILEKELEELKEKMESSEAVGTAREFLDLREQLNKKDKEILEVRDKLTSREKELIRNKDENIALGREKADLIDQVAALQLEQTRLIKERDALARDKELIEKRADDFKGKCEWLADELDARTSELKEVRENHENVMATRDAQDARSREDHKLALARSAERAEEATQKAVQAAILDTQEKAAEAQEAALVVAAEEAKRAQDEALAVREAELRAEQDSKLAALHRANEESLRKLRAEHDQATEEAAQAAAERLAVREGELFREKQGELHAQKATLGAQLSDLEVRRESLEGELKRRTGERDVLKATLDERDSQLITMEASFASQRAESVEIRDKLASETRRLSQARAKWLADSAVLGATKEALSGVLARVEEVLSREMP
jgi:CheY-like chemotaxis protein